MASITALVALTLTLTGGDPPTDAASGHLSLRHTTTIRTGRPIRTLAIDPTGRCLLAGTMDARIQVFAVPGGKRLVDRVGDAGGFG